MNKNGFTIIHYPGIIFCVSNFYIILLVKILTLQIKFDYYSLKSRLSVMAKY